MPTACRSPGSAGLCDWIARRCNASPAPRWVDELLAKARNRGSLLDRFKPYLHERFVRDREPATADEFAMTQRPLDAARDETIRLMSTASAAELDWRDPARRLPDWARWHTARQLAWHIADVESRYYLTGLGLPAPRAPPM